MYERTALVATMQAEMHLIKIKKHQLQDQNVFYTFTGKVEKAKSFGHVKSLAPFLVSFI